ncbi:MAG: hypothetical protein LBU32_18470 [Clostridiales bacterium]|nr:hypothetical protein [Clostridiales bacterium]
MPSLFSRHAESLSSFSLALRAAPSDLDAERAIPIAPEIQLAALNPEIICCGVASAAPPSRKAICRQCVLAGGGSSGDPSRNFIFGRSAHNAASGESQVAALESYAAAPPSGNAGGGKGGDQVDPGRGTHPP